MEELIAMFKRRTGEADETLICDLLETAKSAILARRYPFAEEYPELPERYADIQVRIALDMYNKMGAEGQLSHGENGISRSYQSAWISRELLAEVVPVCGVVS